MSVGRAGAGWVHHAPDAGLSGIEVSVDDVRFRPFDGGGAFGAGGTVEPSLELRLLPEVTDGVLRVAISSSHTRSRGIDPGVVTGLSEWRRLDLSRYAMPYGQTWWQKTTYSVAGDFWFSAHWVMEESNGSRWEAIQRANRGEQPFPAALRVLYEPDTSGACLPVREVLEVRFSKRLWDVVPMPRQAPSEYRDFLAGSVFVDLWGSHQVAELHHLLRTLRGIGGERQSYLVILQNWEVGGWDALLPDSVWMPDYPPNPAVGTAAELRSLCDLGNTMGRFGFRTNYRILRATSPSLKRGLAHHAVNASGKPLDYLRCSDWGPVAARQEDEIRRLFAPTASFTDQMTSGAAPWPWHDYAETDGSRSIRQTLAHQRALAALIKTTHSGPLGSETLIDGHLLGEYVDYGDFGVPKGHERLFSPEYKLRRLHHLSGFHGMGLMYRFYEMAPFKRFHSGTTTFKGDDQQLDDYRACEILFGNGAYICYDLANWRYYLTECLLIGRLQRHYVGRPVSQVLYWHDGRWQALGALVRGGLVPDIVPWHPQTPAYGRIRIEYEDGLQVVVNRLAEELSVGLGAGQVVVLPRSGWAAWRDDGSLTAFSGYWPETQHRVDYLQDEGAEVRYLDPRGERILGVAEATLWRSGTIALSARLERGEVMLDGRRVRLSLPQAAPVRQLRFEFDPEAERWCPVRGILSAESRNGALALRLIAPGAYIRSPALALDGERVKAVEIRMRIDVDIAKPGGLYFTTAEHPNVWSDKLMNFAVHDDGLYHTYRLAAFSHPKWRGQTITGLRLDPVRGASSGTVEIDWIRGAE